MNQPALPAPARPEPVKTKGIEWVVVIQIAFAVWILLYGLIYGG